MNSSNGPRTLRRGPFRVRAAVVAALSAALLVVAVAGCGDSATPPDGRLEVGGLDIAYREVAPQGDGGGVPVLFLHGASYTSAVWEERGILDAVGERSRAVAIDLPGKGDSEGGSPDPVAFLGGVLDALGWERAVIVSPSASGAVSLPFLAARPERVAGYVPVAPVGADAFEWPAAAEAAPPTMVVLGATDSGFEAATRRLAGEIPGARLEVMEGAGHAAYDDDPESFTALLRDFLSDVEP